jgi:hypothetical protein
VALVITVKQLIDYLVREQQLRGWSDDMSIEIDVQGDAVNLHTDEDVWHPINRVFIHGMVTNEGPRRPPDWYGNYDYLKSTGELKSILGEA